MSGGNFSKVLLSEARVRCEHLRPQFHVRSQHYATQQDKKAADSTLILLLCALGFGFGWK
jgi:hypothetical protein